MRIRNGSREASVSFSLSSRAPPLSPRAQSRDLSTLVEMTGGGEVEMTDKENSPAVFSDGAVI